MEKKYSWLKRNLMSRYFEKEPSPYYVYSGHRLAQGENRLVCWADTSHELMDIEAVRVFIRPGTTQVEALRQLKAIRKIIKEEGFGRLDGEIAANNYAIEEYEDADRRGDLGGSKNVTIKDADF